MTSAAGLRAVALAGVAVLALAVALAISQRTGKPEALPEPAGRWYSALAAPYATSKPKKGACGVTIDAKTEGVSHAVLPCGVKIYVRYGGREVLTQVVDRGGVVPGRQFDVTQALAKILRLQGTQPIEWRFAR